ncbi:hypothetical protein TIFTF001_015356 [Ficus carica]|uniref:Uncharacterized protein n=1 Tax=Ficus carica TaxID=3494 RepID=A0AA88A710_FICCA|nr:hypothetical protein TIFTF001_015356 [Ficus carica]
MSEIKVLSGFETKIEAEGQDLGLRSSFCVKVGVQYLAVGQVSRLGTKSSFGTRIGVGFWDESRVRVWGMGLGLGF